MSLLKNIQRLLDFPSNRESLALSEAHKKLSHTYMYVNGRISYVESINSEGSIKIITENNNSEVLMNSEVVSMELFTPEVGIYKMGGSCVFLKKRATRQWRKGFCSDSYVVDGLGEVSGFHVNNMAWSIGNKSPLNMVIYKNKIYYLSLMVAVVNGDNLELHEESFKQEVLDFVDKEFTGHKFIEGKHVTDIQ